MIYFTADTHSLITKEMNEAIISNWNAVIESSDTVYHLGDFAFHRHEEFIKRINGPPLTFLQK